MCWATGGDYVEPSAQDRAVIEQSMQDQRMFEELFLPEEIKYINEAHDPQQEALDRLMLRGKANADVQQAGAANRAAARRVAGTDGMSSGMATAAMASTGDAIETATNAAISDAELEAQGRRDTRRTNIASMGQGIRSQNFERMGAVSRRANSRALSKLQADATEKTAIAQGIGELAGAGMTLGISKMSKKPVQGKNMTITSGGGMEDVASMHGY